MSTDTTAPDTDTTAPDMDTAAPDAGQDTAAPDADTISRTEFEKVRQQRDKLKSELRELRKPKPADTDTDKPAEPTEADKLRTALARTAGVSVLVKAGVTDEADQTAILSIPGMLSDLDVSDDGTVDTEALSERLDTLRRIFTPKDTRRPAPRIRTGQEQDAGPADPDAARYRKILGRQ